MAEVTRSGRSTDRERELERVAEALIYASAEPVSAADIARTVSDVSGEGAPSPEEINGVVERLNARYEETQSALRIHRWGGGFRMATEPELAPYLKSHFDPERQTRLTRSLMETLAILAYRQPVTKPEIDFVRGVDSDYAIRRLLELGLADVVGRSESVGRPLLYGTTPRFLHAFGLESLDALPKLREIEELLGDPSFSRERAKLLALEGLERADSPSTRFGEEGDMARGETSASEQPSGSGVDRKGHISPADDAE